MNKKMVVFLVTLSMIICMNMSAQVDASSKVSSQDLSASTNVVKDFFEAYEAEIGSDYSEDAMEQMLKVSTRKNVNVYNSFNTKKFGDEKTFLNAVDFMIMRNTYNRATYSGDLKEYDKKVSVDVLKSERKADSINMLVQVTKTWYYSTSRDIESGAQDNYEVVLKKENMSWHIDTISGFGASVFNFDLDLQNDQITKSEERKLLEEYIDSCVRESQAEKETSKDIIDETAKTAAAYNGTLASNYALDHAYNYNTNYADFNGSGGDCTNFICSRVKKVLDN